MINARLKSFKTIYGYQKLSDSAAFELLVNNAILEMHQPDVTKSNFGLLSYMSVGGSNDMGIDGIAIKVNGLFVTSIKDVDNIIELHKRINVEFIFVQSKYKESIDSGEYGKFTDGIIDFLGEDHYEPHNEKIDELLRVKDHIFSDDVILRWEKNPSIRIYYVIFGQWRDNPHVLAKTKKLYSDISDLKTYAEVIVTHIDSGVLRKICEENEHTFSTIMNVIDSFELNEVSGVKNSLIVLCNSLELVKMITTDEGIIRKSLFTDNVRDYQGNTSINNEILDTLSNNPSNFSLLNNGITIVCTSIVPSNRKVTLVNPQIVNGCQTCHVLFEAQKQGINLISATIIAKIIATDKDELTNSIVKGTNSQNIVYNEAFEITREFHKNLEEFFVVIQEGKSLDLIYYERRSRQYMHDTSIRPTQVAGLKTLIQSFASIFLRSPHNGSSHEALLLKKYQNVIFVEGQSYYPYFVAALMYLNFEKLMLSGYIARRYETYKNHILVLASEQVAGIAPSINDNKKIDEYCRKLIHVIYDIKEYNDCIKHCCFLIDEVIESWVNSQGKQYRHGIKDNANFTQYMLTYIRGGKTNGMQFDKEEEPNYRGKVVKSKQDRYGYYYGFILKAPENIFFHESDNAKLNFENIYGKTVIYRVFCDSKKGEERAVILDVLYDEKLEN